MKVLKLGGSVITNKDEPETVDENQLERVVETLGRRYTKGDKLVLVHGGGSFGHYRASAHDVTPTSGSTDATALFDIHEAMERLNRVVITHLHERAIPALPVRPLSIVSRRSDGLQLSTTGIEGMLSEGFVPVLHGDIVVHEGHGGTVLSGDELVVELASRLEAEHVGLCSTVSGVLDTDGAVIPEIRSYAEVADVLGTTESTDVTGGMAGKVRELLTLDCDAAIFAPEELGTFLETGTAGTVIR